MKLNRGNIRGILLTSVVIALGLLTASSNAQSARDNEAQKTPESKAAHLLHLTRNRRRGHKVVTRQSRVTVNSWLHSSPPRNHVIGRSRTTDTRWVNSRPMRMRYGPTGRGIAAADWRKSHPDWDGRYFFRGGIYFYDPKFTYPAIVENEWNGIATLAGGAALLGPLDIDPTLVFAGSAGTLYPLSQYGADSVSSNPAMRLRATFFGKPYFWRQGVRYERTAVTQSGTRYYRFARR